MPRAELFTICSTAIGATAEWSLLYGPLKGPDMPLLLQAIGWPGALLSVPIYILGGGVHGYGADLWANSLIPLNGLAYGLMTYACVKLIRKRKVPVP